MAMRRAVLTALIFLGVMAWGWVAISPAKALGSASNGGSAGLSALNGLERGEWELRERGARSAPRRICLGDPTQLLQVQHPGQACRQFVVSDAINHAIVTYQCSASGRGRTDLRVETPRLVQINAQGVADSAPFAMDIEGRKTGACR
jgi:hypothetical protein